MVIRNAGGPGALTVGDGILVVQLLNPTRSADGAFSLVGHSITAGAFDYFLFKGGFSPGSQGNWYLRNGVRMVQRDVRKKITLGREGVQTEAVMASVTREQFLGRFREDAAASVGQRAAS